MAENTSRKSKKSGGKAWKSFTADEYLQGMSQMVHFSAKITNSNTPSLGVRLGAERQGYPYVSAASLAGGIPLDYPDSAPAMMKMVPQVTAVLSGNTQDYADIPEADLAHIRAAAHVLDQPAIPSPSGVAKRLRQIMLQTIDGTDVTLTPLQSAGFSAVLSDRLAAEMAEESSRRRARGALGFGGGNPQNVGQHVRHLWRPLWFNAPHTSNQIREAWRVHYKGVDLSLPRAELLDFHTAWRSLHAESATLVGRNSVRPDMTQHLVRLARIWLARGEAAKTMLRAQQDKLPGGTLLDRGLPLLQQGLVDPSQRSIAWRQQFSRALQEKLITTPVRVAGGEPLLLGVNATDTQGWLSIIEDSL